MKNCGSAFHAEVTNRSVISELQKILRSSQNEQVKEKILELIQAWAHAFRNQPAHCAVSDMYNLLKIEGCKFPPLKESDAMFVCSEAPAWKNGDCCQRCRQPFTMLERKHHCRHCADVFCQKCSSKSCAIPKFGIEKEVRVCDDCFDELSRPDNRPSTATGSLNVAKNRSSSVIKNTSVGPAASEKTKEELEEEEQLELALAISKSEVEYKKEQEQKQYNDYYSRRVSLNNSMLDLENSRFDSSSVRSPPLSESPVMTANLKSYLDREYWERVNSKNNEPSAPSSISIASSTSSKIAEFSASASPAHRGPSIDTSSQEEIKAEKFRLQLASSIEMFVNRMNTNRTRKRPLANDSGAQKMFVNISSMRAELDWNIQRLNDQRGLFEVLQDKITKIKEARVALDALRQENCAKMRADAEKAQLEKKRQLEYKLQEMRRVKQNAITYHQQMAMQQMNDTDVQLRTYAQSNWLPNLYAQPVYSNNMYTSPHMPYSGTPYVDSNQTSVSNYAAPNAQPVSYGSSVAGQPTSTDPAPVPNVYPPAVSDPAVASIAPVSITSSHQPTIPSVTTQPPVPATSVASQPHIASQLAATQMYSATMTNSVPGQAMLIGQLPHISPHAYLTQLPQNSQIPIPFAPIPAFAGNPYNMHSLATALPSLTTGAVQIVPSTVTVASQPEHPKPQVEEAPLISFE